MINLFKDENKHKRGIKVASVKNHGNGKYTSLLVNKEGTKVNVCLFLNGRVIKRKTFDSVSEALLKLNIK